MSDFFEKDIPFNTHHRFKSIMTIDDRHVVKGMHSKGSIVKTI